MKKLILATAAGVLAIAAFSTAASAESVVIQTAVGEPYTTYYYGAPPAYVGQPPVYYQPGYVEYYRRWPSNYYDRRHYHREGDWAYWAARHHNGRW